MSKKQQLGDRKRAILLVFLVLGIVVLGFIIKRIYLSNNERNLFNKTSKIISSIESDIRANKNAAGLTKRDFCSRSSQKFSNGGIYCFSAINFSSGKNDKFNIKELVKDQGIVFQKDVTSDHVSNLLFEEYFFEKDISCTYSTKSIKQSKVEHSFQCSGPAKAEYYPVKEN